MRVKTDERRESIINAAATVFKEEGYERASMDGIAKRVGGSKATLYGYFKSKQELFIATLKQTAECAGSQVEPLLDVSSDDLRGILLRVAKVYVAFLLSTDTILKTRIVIGESSSIHLGEELYAVGPRHGTKLMADFFAEQMKRGRLKKADPLAAALHYKGLVESDHFEAALYGARPSRDPKRSIVDAVDVFLAAYSPADKS
jgi:AcrR family transcriptional regulator